MPEVLDGTEQRRIIFQTWDWSDEGNIYQVHHFIVQEIEGSWQTQHYTTQYRALLRDELSEILENAGFTQINWLMPEESGYYQPIVIGRK
jgi:hypothetical protein